MKGGLWVASDGCVHSQFTHEPSTFRLASKNPNLQNIPREGVARKMFVAPPGMVFWSRDYAGIEAILVGHFAQSARYLRLAKIDIHSFYTAYTLYELEKVLTVADLPDEKWSDTELASYLAVLKKRFKPKRTANKPLVHGGNYLMGPFEAQETILKELHVVVPLRQIKRLQSFYWELFPEIPQWHERVTGKAWSGELPAGISEQEGAHQRGYLRTPFGNIHRYFDVLAWTKGPLGWEAKWGSDAKRAVAFLPQSSGRMVLTRAYQRMSDEVQQTIRLPLHDEWLGLCRDDQLDRCLLESQTEMERPVPELGGLALPTEAKTGSNWGEMREL